MADAVVQVAPDSTGKKVDMELVSTAADPTVYRQRALLVGTPEDAISEIRLLLRQLISIELAILETLQAENRELDGYELPQK